MNTELSIGQNLNVKEARPVVIAKKGRTELPTITHATGEKAGWREISGYDKADKDRMWEIDQKNPGVDNIGGRATSKLALTRWFMDLQRKPGIHIYAVTGQLDNEGKPLVSNQKGEIEGWIRTDETEEERERYKRTCQSDLSDSIPVTELASIKRIDPHMPHGLMSSARRQILLEILRQDINNGLYVGTKDNVIKPRRVVTAYVAHNNTNRLEVIRSLEASGLTKVKEGVEWIEGDPDEICDLYVLDWQKLQEIEERKTQDAILTKLKMLSGEDVELVSTIPDSVELQQAELKKLRKTIKNG